MRILLRQRALCALECQTMNTPIRSLVFVFIVFFPCAAHADLNCGQLVGVAQVTIRQRDQGMSLSQVLAETERAEVAQNLSAQHLNLVRQIVRNSFTSETSPREILENCQAGNLGLPAEKPLAKKP